MNVLIVEDNADSRNLLAKQLYAYGHEVTAAADGVEALELALKTPPDILVSDILMPRMDGYKLCYEWQQDERLKAIPFVFYTAIYTSSEDEKFGLSLGASLFIRKPIEPEALARILSQVFEQAREGQLPAAEAAPPEPALYLTEYNERLVSKLNEKVAELEASEEELRSLSSVLRAIRNINQLIVREKDRTKLLKSACRILHRVREYRFVWIGLIEEGHKKVIPVAGAGVEGKYLDSVEITWDNSPSGMGPTGMAIKTRKPDLVKNIPDNPRSATWRDEALKRGYRSSVSIPLIHGDKVYGALSVYSSEDDGFSDAEVELFEEVSSDLAFALKSIEREEARRRAEHDLKERMKEIRCLYNVEMIGDKPELSLDEIYRKVVEVLPPGWQYPEVTAARLVMDGKVFKTKNYRDSRWKQSAEVKVYGAKVGKVEVVYLEAKPESDEGPFLKEGRRLIDSIAEQLARITERRRAEEELEKERDRAQRYLDISAVMFVVIGKDKKVSLINQKGCQILDCEEGTILGKNWFRSCLPERVRNEVEAGFEKMMAGEVEPMEYHENPVKTKGGEERLIAWRNTVIRDENGQVIATLSSGEDITERKQAEEELRRSEANLAEAQRVAHIGSWELDIASGVLRWSDEVYRIYGMEPQQAGVIYETFRERIHPDDREMVDKAYNDSVKTKTPYNIVHRVRLEDGMVKYVNERGETFYDAKGKPVRSLGTVQDVTERKQAEEKLADEATRRRILIDQSSDGIAILDEKGKIYEANQRFAEMLGYTPEEARELHVWDFEAQSNREQILEMIRTMDESGHHFETRHRRKDGTVFDVEISSNSAVYAGQKLIFSVSRDITERKLAGDALRESEARYRAVIEGAHDMIQSVGVDGRVIFVNKAWLDTLGYTEADISSLNLFDVIHPDSREHCQKVMAGVLKGKSVQDIETAFLTKDGRKVLVEGNAAPRYIGKKVVATQGIFRDVTERKQAEEKLADEATRRRILIDESGDGIVIIDQEGKAYEANRRFAEMLGYTPEEIRQLHVWDWDAQFQREQLNEMIESIGPEGANFETKHRRKDGTVFDVETSNNGAVYAGQKLIFCVSRDITGRKRAAAALKESEEKYKHLVEATSDVIWETDTQGWFTFISPKIKDVLGYEVDEVVGKKRTLDLIPKGEAKKWLKRFKEVNVKKTPFFGFEIPHIHKNGSQLMCETSGIPLFDSAGDFKGYVGIDKDITERRQMQEQLVIADRLASVGELAAGIAHELNNPLTGVIGFSQLLLDKEMPDDVRQDVKVVYSEAQRASQVVKNLLTFARKHTAAKEKVNINEVIGKVLELRAYEQNLENITVDARFDPALPEVMADYFQLQQVFLNIIINAEYFMKETHHKGKLTITTEKADNRVRASIADDGPGIASDDLGHLFDPFFTTKEVGKGTGLGLSICHGIVAEHGGRIYVESETGKGATFIVELPIGAAEKKGGRDGK